MSLSYISIWHMSMMVFTDKILRKFLL
ncbi:protein of unknown function [Magnetospirillum sp. XM-1]|nr:protein of unknown function [Magnetospirillum sp. XM-1]